VTETRVTTPEFGWGGIWIEETVLEEENQPVYGAQMGEVLAMRFFFGWPTHCRIQR